MPLRELLPVGPDTAQWPLWSTTARLVVSDPARLSRAREVVTAWTGAVERACSRFHDSELARLPRDGAPTAVSPLLAELVEVAVRAAERTDGAVDPTLAGPLRAAGYDRDFALMARTGPAGPALVPVPPATWAAVRVERGGLLTVPRGVTLDLGATAKAWAVDTCARAVVEECGGSALVALGGDVATAGERAWEVLVQDGPAEPGQTVRLDPGGAVATSSTVSRTWERGGHRRHHVLDPATGAPADPVWRTVSVVAGSCVDANTVSTGAVVLGVDALPWLRELGVPARLVGRSGRVLTLGGWPA